MRIKQLLPYIVIAVLCLPLLFINIKDTHDWGDDFAQYIHQAINITEGIPQSETGYIYNEKEFIGPPAYPVGFPLLLASVYSIFGNDIEVFNIFMSVLLFLFCIAMFRFFSQYYSAFTAVLLTLLVAWNPWLWTFKTEIMSDIPFSLLLLVCVLLYLHAAPKIWYAVMLGLLGGLLVSIRSIGLIFPVAVLIDMLLKAYGARKDKAAIKRTLVPPVVMLGTLLSVYILLNLVLFPLPSGDAIQYPKIVDLENFWSVLGGNIKYNAEVLQVFFTPAVKEWKFMTVIINAAVIVFLLLGMLAKYLRKIEFIDIVFLLYVIVILVFPYGDAGFRFILPAIPFIIYYMAGGVRAVPAISRWNSKVVALLLAGSVLLHYRDVGEWVIDYQHLPYPGPQEQSSQDAFEHIKERTPADAVIVFAKPRALALYTGRKALINTESLDAAATRQFMKERGVDYCIVHTELTGNALREFVKDSTAVERTWSNDKFEVYKVK
jgi:hypothetical protein